MSLTLAQIWRHPIKGIGAEALSAVRLDPDRPLPGDRAWAVLRAGQSATGGWQRCATFLRGAHAPALMAVSATLTGDRIDLRHPDRAPLSIDPETDSARLVAWIGDLWPADAPAPDALVKAPEQGMSDADFASVSVLNLASLRALSDAVGHRLDPRRFRANLWIDGAPAWDEAGWIGRRLGLGGSAVLEIVEPIGRCRATEANPETGQRDTPVLDALDDLRGETVFGVYARVTRGGEVSVGDSVALL